MRVRLLVWAVRLVAASLVGLVALFASVYLQEWLSVPACPDQQLCLSPPPSALVSYGSAVAAALSTLALMSWRRWLRP